MRKKVVRCEEDENWYEGGVKMREGVIVGGGRRGVGKGKKGWLKDVGGDDMGGLCVKERLKGGGD